MNTLLEMKPADFKARREALGLSQRKIAKALGVSAQAIFYWEHGERPMPRMLDLALEALEVRAAGADNIGKFARKLEKEMREAVA